MTKLKVSGGKMTAKQQKQANKELAVRIELAQKESRLLTVVIPKGAAQEAKEWFGLKKGLKVLHIRPHQTDNQAVVFVIETEKPTEENSFFYGESVAEVTTKAKGYLQVKEIQKQQKIEAQDFLKMRFPKDIGLAMFLDMASRFKIVKKIASIDGREIELHFDTSDCATKEDWKARVVAIFDAMDSIRLNLRAKGNAVLFAEMMKDLDRLQPIEKTAIRFKRVTGAEVVERGLSEKQIVYVENGTRYTEEGNWFNRFLLWLKGGKRQQIEIVDKYYNRIVEPYKQYVIECNQPCEKQNVNHLEELELRFDFGEQQFAGMGLRLCELYVKDMFALHNSAIEPEE